jgi:hypothetical protein
MKNKKYHTVPTAKKYHTVPTAKKYHTVPTAKKYHTVPTVKKFNRKIVERGNVNTLNTQIHDHSKCQSILHVTCIKLVVYLLKSMLSEYNGTSFNNRIII